jgi:hypothetical protein
MGYLNFWAKKKAWRLPTLPPFGSTIGARGLDFRVRDGNGYGTSAVATGPKTPRSRPRAMRAGLPAGPPIRIRDRYNNMVKPHG